MESRSILGREITMESQKRARGLGRKGILLPVLAMVLVTAVVTTVTGYAATNNGPGVLDQLSDKYAKVLAVSYEESEKSIPFDTVYEEDSEMYEDEEIVKVEGEKGSVLITEKVTDFGGKETKREIVSFDVLSHSVDRVVVKGTKERSYFVWPHGGPITSYFGYRWDAPGTYDHQGMDIDAHYGDAVIAARSGVVTEDTGWDGGYGLCVHIDHGDGIETLYGHNCELLVSPGEQVEAGQVIAYAGSTGWSSGVHVHFEVRENGTAIDPLSLLP